MEILTVCLDQNQGATDGCCNGSRARKGLSLGVKMRQPRIFERLPLPVWAARGRIIKDFVNTNLH